MDERRLLCILAHPDDESLATGGLLARYAAEGVATYLATMTRGERGRVGNSEWEATPAAVGALREAELRAAAAALGVREVKVLGFPDGGVAEVDPEAAIGALVALVRRWRPEVAITFPPDGITGHPDHIATSQLATAAVVRAADPSHGEGPAHQVAKLYYLAPSGERLAGYSELFGDPAMRVDGVERRIGGWPAWAITTRVDAGDQWRRVGQAIACHQTQLPAPWPVDRLPPEALRRIWGRQELYRVYSLAGGSIPEEDLFAGL